MQAIKPGRSGCGPFICLSENNWCASYMLGHTEHLYKEALKPWIPAVASKEDNQRLGWGEREADTFSCKAFGCFGFLFKSDARGFMCVRAF